MTEVVTASSQPGHHSAPTGPFTRSAMAARPARAASALARQHESETSPAASLASSGSSPPPQPPSGSSVRGSISRKRAASINTEEANRPKVESLSLGTPSTTSPRPFDASRDLICLCTPAPKVPRPRNGMTATSLFSCFLLLSAFKPTYLSFSVVPVRSALALSPPLPPGHLQQMACSSLPSLFVLLVILIQTKQGAAGQGRDRQLLSTAS